MSIVLLVTEKVYEMSRSGKENIFNVTDCLIKYYNYIKQRHLNHVGLHENCSFMPLILC